MAESREERMQQRMRGAGRHEVADESFGLILPVEESPEVPVAVAVPPPPVTATRSTPNTSAKRRRLNSDTNSTRLQAVPSSTVASEPPSSASKADPYDVLQVVSPDVYPPVPALSSSGSPRVEDVENAEGKTESLLDLAARPTSRGSIISLLSIGPNTAEEVAESPADAPGSGRRRRVRISDATTQSVQLQKAVMAEEASITGEVATSSPLARKTRTSGATSGSLTARSIRTSSRSASADKTGQNDDLPSVTRPPRKSNSTAVSGSVRSVLSGRRSTLSTVVDDQDELSSPVPPVESRRRAQAKTKTKPKHATIFAEVEATAEDDEQGGADEEEAEEIDVDEAARRIGRKRPRMSPPRQASPELDSGFVEPARPAKKRRQKHKQDSPAKQSQPNPQKSKAQKSKAQSSRRRQSGDEHIPITVQRYTGRHHYNEEDTSADILNSEIPFTNRVGVNVVDVLSQMCEEVIDSNLAILQEAAVKTADPATRKEYRAKLRALEAFHEQLRNRLLEHTIALDTLHALKKRVRSVQKEKLALRNEIIRIRAEKEQVALKMDAVRIRHETESNESLHQLNLSSTMHDIDLAVENGRSSSDLDPKKQKTADLANLELLVSRVAGHACDGSDGPGSLKQLKNFNAFLERAAAALEAR